VTSVARSSKFIFETGGDFCGRRRCNVGVGRRGRGERGYVTVWAREGVAAAGGATAGGGVSEIGGGMCRGGRKRVVDEGPVEEGRRGGS